MSTFTIKQLQMSHLLFFFSATPWLAVLLISSDESVIEVRHQEGRVVSLSHCLSHLRDVWKQEKCFVLIEEYFDTVKHKHINLRAHYAHCQLGMGWRLRLQSIPWMCISAFIQVWIWTKGHGITGEPDAVLSCVVVYCTRQAKIKQANKGYAPLFEEGASCWGVINI